jgi:hypothetical protein
MTSERAAAWLYTIPVPAQPATTRTIIVPQVVRRTFATGYAGA